MNFPTFTPRPEAEMREWLWRNEIVPRLKAAGFAPRFWQEITDWNCKPQQRVFEECRRLCVGNGAIVVLTGARGTGKTTIAGQLAVERAKAEDLPPWDRQPPYRKMQDLFERYKALYANFGHPDMDALASQRDWYCGNPSLAVIDEIHECAGSRDAERMLTDILDRRYSSRKDTILISNESVDDFQRNHSESILSRISEHGRIIPCNWKSWRAKAA